MSIQSFTDLIAWKKAHAFVIKIYSVLQKLPKSEEYGITSQIKRAVVSISSNIAEGFSRKNMKEKIQFYYIALGSLTELQNQLLIIRDLHFISTNEFNSFADDTIELSKLIHGLIKYLKP